MLQPFQYPTFENALVTAVSIGLFIALIFVFCMCMSGKRL